ncbi:hypothetical protein RQP46_003966 [Phenoliferia psychrophenolica]
MLSKLFPSVAQTPPSPSPAPSRPVPSFLAWPLSSSATFSSIYATLTSREQTRISLAALSHPSPHSHATPRDSSFACVAGTARDAVKKNRYGDIVAYDRTRVLLPSSEYVNASLVGAPEVGLAPDDPERTRSWVAAQGPINSTVHAFLSLLLSAPTSPLHPSPDLPLIQLIIQLTPLVEQRREKCHAYFPRNQGETWAVAPAPESHAPALWVRLDAKEESEGRRVSRVSLGWEGDSNGRVVTHVEYLGWGDHGVPDSPSHLLSFIHATLPLSPTPSTPILVHCSAGVGRTGTFLTIASLLPLLAHHTSPSIASPPSPPPPPPRLTELGPYPLPEELRRAGVLHDYVGATVDWWRDHRVMMVRLFFVLSTRNMVLSTSSSAPVVIVTGITGRQGGSVARALIASTRPYRIIGITRDPARPSAKEWLDLGVELRQADIAVGNESAVVEALKGGQIVFGVTNFNEHGDKDREIAEGKLLVDASIAAQISLFLWSSLEPFNALSSGRYPCDFFDSKAEVTAYLKTKSLPWANVPCGLFATAFTSGVSGPVRQNDGSYVLRLPAKASTRIPVLDPIKDYGKYVVFAIEGEGLGAGSEVLSGRLTSMDEIVEGLSKASGKKVIFQQVDEKTFEDDVLGPFNLGPLAGMLVNMWAAYRDVGYYGPKDVEASQAQATGIVPRTWDEVLSTLDEPLFV